MKKSCIDFSMILICYLFGYYAFLGNSPPTPPLTQHFALSDNKLIFIWLGEG